MCYNKRQLRRKFRRQKLIFINNTSVDKYILTLRDLCLRCEPQANNVKKIDEGLRYLSIRVLFNIFPIGNSVDMFICIVERSSCREWMSLRFRKKYRIKLPKYGRNCCLWSQQRSMRRSTNRFVCFHVQYLTSRIARYIFMVTISDMNVSERWVYCKFHLIQ